jgi:hypothetical protein
MYTVVITSDPNSNSQIASVRVRELGSAQQRGKRRGTGTWCVLVAGKMARRRLGEGTDEDLGTWRRAPSAVAQLSPRARKGERERADGRRGRQHSAAVRGRLVRFSKFFDWAAAGPKAALF